MSKYLLEPAFLRELYLFELATTIALMREEMISVTAGQTPEGRARLTQEASFDQSSSGLGMEVTSHGRLSTNGQSPTITDHHGAGSAQSSSIAALNL